MTAWSIPSIAPARSGASGGSFLPRGRRDLMRGFGTSSAVSDVLCALGGLLLTRPRPQLLQSSAVSGLAQRHAAHVQSVWVPAASSVLSSGG
eukprot:CAMPEP_0175905676 /NCGR_PEP_ID=MMETSP0108-20121206/5141_1 /TAXON_ID=195067 ORGANISM="Goniomonas pacifica, Strain CCMP1869" /NCGR_SAMPLE_ID=MMETSP0108 /ASSEMBLY_ACC=CAM_ASM_000204 /LENGTH=91 /DNA_ID=CAMNT_0017227579 /DNA_START=229 /DNA_END=500 /DNA_ORIENTATION=+